jgi:hypothetical protein
LQLEQLLKKLRGNPKDWPPGLPKPGHRVWSLGTGLLEIEILETALKRIRARKA